MNEQDATLNKQEILEILRAGHKYDDRRKQYGTWGTVEFDLTGDDKIIKHTEAYLYSEDCSEEDFSGKWLVKINRETFDKGLESLAFTGKAIFNNSDVLENVSGRVPYHCSEKVSRQYPSNISIELNSKGLDLTIPGSIRDAGTVEDVAWKQGRLDGKSPID